MINYFGGTFLSNFWPCLVVVDRLQFKSAEHAYQAQKVTNFDDLAAVRRAPTPGQAKRIARACLVRSDWDQVKLGCMLQVLRAKFSTYPLADQLRATGDQELVEGNTWGDTYWGVYKGVGENHLGKLLMQVRAEIAR